MNNARVIKEGTVLNGKYIIESVIGEGGFGITYKAKDTILNETVAIKEYFPSTLGTRDTTAEGATNDITIISTSNKAAFDKGLERFKNEAANLAKFNQEPGIVSVKNFFMENNTGYMVMEYIDGTTLKEYLDTKDGKLSYTETISLMSPVMDSLSVIHKSSIIHRDISPDNIMVTKEGKLKLIDFGAARYVGNEDEKSLTVMLKAGFAPIEQYNSNGNQGPWTDVYALCATIYRMISGVVPVEAVERVMDGKIITPVRKLNKKIPENISTALEKGLEIDDKTRWQSIDELRTGLNENKGNKEKKPLIIGTLAIAVAVIVAGVTFIIVSSHNVYNNNDTTSEVENVPENIVEPPKKEEPESEQVKEEEQSEKIAEGEAIQEEELEPQTKYLYAYAYANIRKTPEIDSSNVIRKCKVGEEFEVLEKVEDDWIKVLCDENEAYIKGEFLISKEDLETWTEYYDKVLIATGAEKRVFEGTTDITADGKTIDLDSLQGAFNDYDGDGEKELFVEIICMRDGGNVASMGADQATIECDRILYFANKEKVEKVYTDWIIFPTEDIVGKSSVVVAYNTIENVGKNVFYIYRTYNLDSDCPVYDYYTVEKGKPKALEFIRMDKINGIHLAKGETDHIYYTDDKTEYTGILDDGYLYESGAWYPWYYLNDNVGQISSCKVDISDIEKLKGYKAVSEVILDDFMKKTYVSFGQEGISAKVKGITIDSAYYNEAGFFVFNYLVDSWETDENERVNYCPEWVCDVEGIRYISGHAMVACNDGRLELLYTSWGKYKESMDNYPVLIESDFRNFGGLE